jgi:hypothetical protein
MATEHPRASLKRIKLTLARSKNHPNGSTECGYDLVAPLDDSGHIDLATWKTHRGACTVRRFLEGQDDKMGLLVHKAGGVEHSHWVFDYDVADEDDDEPGFLFGSHTFVPGEYVSVRGTDGAMHTFAVSSVNPL